MSAYDLPQERLEELEDGGGDNNKALARRFEKLRGEYEREEANKAVGKRMDEALRSLHKGSFDSAVTRSEYWEWHGRFNHGLVVDAGSAASSAAGAWRGSSIPQEDLVRHTRLLEERGFMIVPDVDWGPDVSLPRLVGAMQELKSQGWPACFIFAYQEVPVPANANQPATFHLPLHPPLSILTDHDAACMCAAMDAAGADIRCGFAHLWHQRHCH